MYKTEKIYGKQDIPTYLERYVAVEEFLETGKGDDNHNKSWASPAYEFDVMEYWRKYGFIHIIGRKIIFDEETISMQRTPAELEAYLGGVLKAEKQKLADILYEAEARYPGSISLSAGCCHLCETCERVAARPCKYPDKLRYSMESLGANVGKTCSKLLRIELLWAEENRLPKYFVLISALLADDEEVTFYAEPS